MSAKTYSLAKDGRRTLSPNLKVAEFACHDGTDICVILAEKGVLQKEIETKLKVFTSKAGKSGIAVVVDMAMRDVESPDLPGPEWEVLTPVTTYEFSIVNRGLSGTGKDIQSVVSKLGGLLAPFFIQDLGTTVYLDKNAATPGVGKDNVAFIELMTRAQVNQTPEEKVSAPKVSGTAGAVTIEAGRMYGITVGSVVYYTTDGSYPTPGAAGTTLYGTVLLSESGQPLLSEDGLPLTAENTPAPLVVAAGTLVLANAWKTGMQHSDLAGKQF